MTARSFTFRFSRQLKRSAAVFSSFAMSPRLESSNRTRHGSFSPLFFCLKFFAVPGEFVQNFFAFRRAHQNRLAFPRQHKFPVPPFPSPIIECVIACIFPSAPNSKKDRYE